MKDKLTDLTIYGLIGLGVLTALEITQATWEWDLIPEDLEQFVYGLTGAIGALILFLFLASFIIELQGIRKSLETKAEDNGTN
jgi:TRAP-type C4-dicarboxylate transport system permease small subunit